MHEVILEQSEIGIDVDLDPESEWWQTLLKVLAVIAVCVGAIIAILAVPRNSSTNNKSCYDDGEIFNCYRFNICC